MDGTTRVSHSIRIENSPSIECLIDEDDEAAATAETKSCPTPFRRQAAMTASATKWKLEPWERLTSIYSKKANFSGIVRNEADSRSNGSNENKNKRHSVDDEDDDDILPRKRSRTYFSPYQLEEMEKAFPDDKFLPTSSRRELSQRIRVPEYRVQVWFQNRRAKWKRQYYDCRPTFQQTSANVRSVPKECVIIIPDAESSRRQETSPVLSASNSKPRSGFSGSRHRNFASFLGPYQMFGPFANSVGPSQSLGPFAKLANVSPSISSLSGSSNPLQIFGDYASWFRTSQLPSSLDISASFNQDPSAYDGLGFLEFSLPRITMGWSPSATGQPRYCPVAAMGFAKPWGWPAPRNSKYVELWRDAADQVYLC